MARAESSARLVLRGIGLNALLAAVKYFAIRRATGCG
jgi:ABC-type enterobactin transport system permease subunit